MRNVIVVQQGARRNYIYARQLEAAGRLKYLLTDIATTADSNSHCGRLIKRYASRRVINDIAGNRLVSSVLPNLISVLRYFIHEEWIFPIIDDGLALGALLSPMARSVGKGDIVLNYFGNGGVFLNYAKRRGAVIMTDFIVTPLCLDIVAKEREIWPTWEKDGPSLRLRKQYKQRISKLLRLSDIYLCPSQTVMHDLSTLPGFDASKVRITPYGVSGILLLPPKTKVGRVVFSGAAGLRKGLPYLAKAASLLKKLDPTIEVIVAGHVDPQIAAKHETRDLNFLGHLSRSAMAEEFAKADVYCLPSLAEGSATSVFEALANGLPIVTTLSAGSMATNGKEGFIVPERDSQATADAILKIVTNRKLRANMSAAALKTAAAYSDEACGRIFMDVIRGIKA